MDSKQTVLQQHSFKEEVIHEGTHDSDVGQPSVLLPLPQSSSLEPQDFTGPDGQAIKAGRHVLCPQAALLYMNRGMVSCNLIIGRKLSRSATALPPAVLGRCSRYVYTTFRSILPAYMRPPGWGKDQPGQQGVAYSH
jgi:hypothetical protein